MTEDEAKTKWCPFARVTDLDGTAPPSNRYSSDAAEHPDDENIPAIGSLCIASECMAWRWHGQEGFCGLAGKAGRP